MKTKRRSIETPWMNPGTAFVEARFGASRVTCVREPSIEPSAGSDREQSGHFVPPIPVSISGNLCQQWLMPHPPPRPQPAFAT